MTHLRIHVMPVNDLKVHEKSRACACTPKVEIVEGGNEVVIHNSWDGREILERAVDSLVNN